MPLIYFYVIVSQLEILNYKKIQASTQFGKLTNLEYLTFVANQIEYCRQIEARIEKDTNLYARNST